MKHWPAPRVGDPLIKIWRHPDHADCIGTLELATPHWVRWIERGGWNFRESWSLFADDWRRWHFTGFAPDTPDNRKRFNVTGKPQMSTGVPA